RPIQEAKMRTKISHPAIVVLILLASAGAQDRGVPAEVQNAAAHFSKSAFRANMRFLADDLLEGRGTGTRGQELAARYVAAQFEAFGLEPGGTNGSYLQAVPFREITVDPAASECSVSLSGVTTRLQWGADCLVRGSELAPDITVEAPVVFVGFGVVDRAR